MRRSAARTGAELRLDEQNGQVWQGDEVLPLTPKLGAVLQYLMGQAGRVVPKEELLQAVWPDTWVSVAGLKNYIHELRGILGETPSQPQYLETVGRRGYRFIGPVARRPPAGISGPASSPPPVLSAPPMSLVGREVELGRLEQAYARAAQGQRQVVFVTGEPGIGKTTVVDAFVASLGAEVGVSRGQCVEQYGVGEAYLPVLEVLSRLGRGVRSGEVLGVLAQYAPTWLMQLPALVRPEEAEALQRQVAGATKERMLREAGDAVEVLTAERPLVVVLEDLHWSDTATIELVTLLARRREAAKLLVIGTYRPVDVAATNHPLKAAKPELQTHGQCEEIALSFLTEEAIRGYLAGRFPAHALPMTLARALQEQTEGNPLFLVNMVNDWVQDGVVAESEGQWRLMSGTQMLRVRTPENLRQVIERQLERLSEEARQVLEVASVAGVEFSAAILGVEGLEPRESERHCEQLARRGQFLQARGVVEWPNGTVAGRYGFQHALYQKVLYDRLAPGQRVRLHQQIGTLLETAYGPRAQEIAATLAVHFEVGRETKRAVQYHGQAAQVALQRSALHEAMTHLEKGLALVATLPDTPERAQQELALQLTLGAASLAAKGLGAVEVGHAFARARELNRQFEDSPQNFPILIGLCVFYLSRAELQTSFTLAQQCLRLAEQTADPGLLVAAHQSMGTNLETLGALSPARDHYEQALALYDPQRHRGLTLLAGSDPGIDAGGMLSWTLWHLGYPDQALSRSQWANALARDLGHTNTSAILLAIHAFCLMLRGDLAAAQTQAEATIAFCAAQGVPTFVASGLACLGWVHVRQGREEEGLAQLRQGLADYEATGTLIYKSWYVVLLVDACRQAGQFEEGFAALADAFAFVEETDERVYEAELWRLQGELLLAQTKQGQNGEKRRKQAREGKRKGQGRTVG